MFKGTCTAMITPFSTDGKEVNYEAFKKQIDYQINSGTSALLFLGTTGEPPTLSYNEQKQIIKFAVEYVAGRVPVIAGAGSNCTKTAVKKAKEFEKLGANALLVVTPYYNKCTQKGLIKHYQEIASQTTLPIILYNVPGRTGVNILPQTVSELAKIKNVVAIKEASGSVSQMMEIKRLCPNLTLYSGDDGIVLPVLSIGGKGVISVASNIIPKKMSELCKSFFEGNIKKARELQFEVSPLIKLLFIETNPTPVKTAMNLMNMKAGKLRLPLIDMEKQNKEALELELKKLKLIK